jgi:membrane-associated phospholipid phosphatase
MHIFKNKKIISSLMFITVLLTSTSGHTKSPSWSAISDMAAVGLVTVTSATTDWGRSDPVGFRQYVYGLTSTVVFTHGLKVATGVERPDGSDKRSFPSEHTAVAFSSIGFLAYRYGDQISKYKPGLFAAGALTAIGRVQGNKHRWGDVIVGAGIGWLNGYLWTDPIRTDRAFYLTPLPSGVSLTYYRSW